MKTLPPIFACDLFREVCAKLHELLAELTPAEWHLPTSSSRRTVKDIVSHLLDGSLRRLSIQRDGYRSPDAPARFESDRELHEYLHRLNDEWTVALCRLSPRILIDQLRRYDFETADLFASLDPFGPALFPVSWAGEQASLHWFDVARDFTEKWHHTQQIFEATGRPSTITEPRLFHPCLDTFLRGLPFAFRQVDAPTNTVVAVSITGEAGGIWFLERSPTGWQQVVETDFPIRSQVTLDQTTAWKLVTKRRTRDAVREQLPDIHIAGNIDLGGHVLDMVSMVT